MRIVQRVLIVLLAVWMETSFFGQLRPFGVIPNLAVIVVVLSGLLSEATPTVATAIGIGLMLDLSSGTDFGLRTAFLAALGLVVITARQYGVHSDSVATVWGMLAAGTVVFELLLLVSLGIGSWSGQIGYIAARIGVETAMTIGIGTVGYVLASAVARRSPGSMPRSPI